MLRRVPQKRRLAPLSALVQLQQQFTLLSSSWVRSILCGICRFRQPSLNPSASWDKTNYSTFICLSACCLQPLCSFIRFRPSTCCLQSLRSVSFVYSSFLSKHLLLQSLCYPFHSFRRRVHPFNRLLVADTSLLVSSCYPVHQCNPCNQSLIRISLPNRGHLVHSSRTANGSDSPISLSHFPYVCL